MSGPQFAHIETYSLTVSSLRREREAARAAEGKITDRKLSAEEVCGEAARTQGNAPHVETPLPPNLLLGISPDLIPALLKERVALANQAINDKKKAMDRGSRSDGTKAIRKDTHVLLTVVTSYPVPRTDDGTGRRSLQDPDELALYLQWRAKNVEHFRALGVEHGFEPLSVVEHQDEEYPHLHGLGVAIHERLNARAAHPGYVAKAQLSIEPGESTAEFRKRQDHAYKAAMRKFQDDYHDLVGLDSGLTRLGPKRRRLSRSAWMSEKTQAKALGAANLRADRATQAAVEAERIAKEAEDRRVGADAATTRAQIRLDEALVECNSTITAFRAVAESVERQHGRLSELKQRTGEAHATLQDVENAQTAMERSLSGMVTQAANLTGEIKLKETALAEIERRQEEAREHLAAERAKIAFEERSLAENRAKFASEQATFEKSRSSAIKILESDRLTVEDVRLGIAAFAAGRIIYHPEDDGRFGLLRSGEDTDTILSRLKRSGSILKPIIADLDEKLQVRLASEERALLHALDGWETKRLRLAQDPVLNRGSKLHFTGDANDPLSKLIKSHSASVTRLLRALPDRQLLEDLQTAVTQLGSAKTMDQQRSLDALQLAHRRIVEGRGR